MPSYGTSLPASPIDGQEAILVDSPTNPTYQWKFRYNAGSTSPYRWEFIGGAPLRSVIPAALALSSVGGWTAATPAVSAPRAGDYLLSVRVMAQVSGNPLLGLATFASGVLLQDGTAHVRASTWQGIEVSDSFAPAVAAGAQLALGYYTDTAGQLFQSRTLTVYPVRIS
jgi:hypothetical protein